MKTFFTRAKESLYVSFFVVLLMLFLVRGISILIGSIFNTSTNEVMYGTMPWYVGLLIVLLSIFESDKIRKWVNWQFVEPFDEQRKTKNGNGG